MEENITFSTEFPDFLIKGQTYCFITFKLGDNNALVKNKINIFINIFSYFSYDEIIAIVNESSFREKINVYIKNILKKMPTPFECQKSYVRYMGISPKDLFNCKTIEYNILNNN